MADLISREAAIARIDKCVALSGIEQEPVMAVRDIKALISVLPAVNAVPVVRCRDCEFYGEEPIGTLKECYRGCGWTKPSDYCSRGKRRESE